MPDFSLSTQKIKEIDRCQLCDCNELTTYLNFGSSPLANSLKETENQEEFQAPLEIVKCENPKCECFQLRHLVSPEILFSNYNYRSSVPLQKHFEEYAKHTFDLLKLNKGDLMVGIGGNIGQLEKAYKDLGMCEVNIEPATNIALESRKNGVFTVNSFFDKDTVRDFPNEAKLICGNNVLAHCDLNPIIEGIKHLLHKDGVLIIENAYWLDSVKNSDAFQCYSEHYFYHHIKGLKNFFDLHGFDLFNVTFNSVQCGSFRIYVKWKENTKFEIDESVSEAIKNEEEYGLYKKETYDKFLAKLNDIKIEINKLLKEITDKENKIGLFSVAAKTTLMIKYLNLSQYILFASDDSEIKYNKFIPGTSIKIVDKETFKKQNFDYILVGAYNFFQEIVRSHSDYSRTWIACLPEIKIVKT